MTADRAACAGDWKYSTTANGEPSAIRTGTGRHRTWPASSWATSAQSTIATTTSTTRGRLSRCGWATWGAMATRPPSWTVLSGPGVTTNARNARMREYGALHNVCCRNRLRAPSKPIRAYSYQYSNWRQFVVVGFTSLNLVLPQSQHSSLRIHCFSVPRASTRMGHPVPMLPMMGNNHHKSIYSQLLRKLLYVGLTQGKTIT